MLHSLTLFLQIGAVASPAQPAVSHEHAPAAVVAPAQAQSRIKLVVAPTGNETRFRVNETLVGMELPNDAVGRTGRITGALVVQPNGQIVTAESRFEVELDSLVSDQANRDRYIKTNTLATAQFPKAVFVPNSAKGLPARIPVAQDLTFELVGDLTVRDVTKPVTWTVTGKMLPTGEISGTATTTFTFADFNLQKPSVRRVLGVRDEIKLEYDFRLVPAPATPDR